MPIPSAPYPDPEGAPDGDAAPDGGSAPADAGPAQPEAQTGSREGDFGLTGDGDAQPLERDLGGDGFEQPPDSGDGTAFACSCLLPAY